MEKLYQGGCRCGAVRYEARGEPLRVGLCHCTDCRRETGGTFLYYADWPYSQFAATGSYSTFEGRSFCAACGAPVFHLSSQHAEIVLGSLDTAPAGLVPTLEGWIKRREPWLAPIPGAAQFPEDIA